MFYNVALRNRDLMAEIRSQATSARRRGEPMGAEKIVERAITSEAPHYYFSFENAVRKCRLLRRQVLRIGNSKRLSQWDEFYSKVEKYMAENPKRRLPEAVNWVLHNSRASSYFLSLRQGLAIYHENLRLGHYNLTIGETGDKALERVINKKINV